MAGTAGVTGRAGLAARASTAVSADVDVDVDVVVVVIGAGIVGLAHALAAVDRGLSVAVVERDDRATGASVRNFGHACATAQAGTALAYGRASRATWLRLADAAGFWIRRTGTVMVARAADEAAVLKEFAELRGAEARMLSAAEVAARVPSAPDVVAGAWLPDDLRVDPRECVPAIAAYLAARSVDFHWGTTAHTIEPGHVATSRGAFHARAAVIVAAGHDVDRHFPDLVASHQLRRCALRMLRVDNPTGARIDPACRPASRCCATAASPSARPCRRCASASPPSTRSCWRWV